MVNQMSCENCSDCKIYIEELWKGNRKTYVCYIDGHTAKDVYALEETCPFLECIDLQLQICSYVYEQKSKAKHLYTMKYNILLQKQRRYQIW